MYPRPLRRGTVQGSRMTVRTAMTLVTANPNPRRRFALKNVIR